MVMYHRHEDEPESDEDATLASELLVAGVPRDRVKGLFHGRMRTSHVDQLADSVMAHKLETGAAAGAEMPEIKQLVKESEPPKDCLDPLFMHLMKDPVVLSSGKILDRNSAVDELGNLRFKRCPFTRMILEKSVYPLDEKKEQIKEFRRKRDATLTKIATKLIANGSFKTFGGVLEAVEDYLKDLGDSNYLPLARELADIWSGIDGSSSIPLFLFVDELKGQVRQNRWHCALKSGKILYDVGKILVAAEHIGSQGRGGHKTRFALVLYNEHEILVERCEIFQHNDRPRTSSAFHLFNVKDRIVAKAAKDFSYRLEYIVDDGHTNDIDVSGFICKIFPESFNSPYYRMRDQDGEMGLFMGSVDSAGKANGDGSMEYDDGKRFVGQFHNGMMSSGVLYRGPRALFTMKGGRWSKPPNLNTFVLSKNPQEVIILTADNDPDSSHLPQEEARETREVRSARETRRTREISPKLERENPLSQYSDDHSALYQSRPHNSRTGTLKTASSHVLPSLGDRAPGSRHIGGIRSVGGSLLGDRHVSPSLGDHAPKSRHIGGTSSVGGASRHDMNEHTQSPNRDANADSHRDTEHSRSTPVVLPVVPSSVPGYIPRRGKNHDEYSEVTKSTWHEHDQDLGSLASDNERDIILEEIPEILTKSRSSPLLEEKQIPIFFSVKKVQGCGTNNEWQCAVQSGPLLDQVSKVMVAVDLKDDHECSLALSLYNKREQLVERCNITEKLKRADEKGSYYRILTDEDDIVSKARPDSKYKLEYVLGDSGEVQTLHAEGWVCKIFPASMNLPMYQMQDQDGENGIYMGPIDSHGKANGSGVMEYNDGKRFVGIFKHGDMFQGVLYYGSDFLCSMDETKWDTENRNDHLLKRHPQRVHMLKNSVGIC